MIKSTKAIGIIFILVFSLQSAYSESPKAPAVQFIENKGQIVDQNYNPNLRVRYLLSRPGFNVQLRATGFSYDTYTDQEKNASTNSSITQKLQAQIKHSPSRHYHRVDVELINCNPSAEITAYGRSEFCFNYFTEGTAQGGVSDVHSYEKVVYKNIYPFIDLEFVSPANEDAKQATEYQFVLHAGAKISDIQLAYIGMDGMNLEKGQLNIKVDAGVFNEKIPSSYLKATGKQVDVQYAASANNIYTFEIKHPFAITSDLVIDPTPCFVWGTYYGGNGWDLGSGIALDDSNNVYIAGSTTSTDNIATAGAYQTTFSAGDLYNIFLAKFNPTGTTLLWGTYYGGQGDDGENGIAIDSSGVYITGYSLSPGLATPGAWLTTCTGCNQPGGYAENIVAKFSLTGALVWGTYYGATALGTQGCAIAVNASGVYITGQTASTAGIGTPGAWQPNYGGGGNPSPFVAKFNLSGSQLLWGTYYGINSWQSASWGLALDPAGNVYIGGTIGTPDTPKITPGAYQTVYGGGADGFLAKFDPTGDSLLYGTYFGGPGDDIIYGLTADSTGNVYFTGNTTSTTGIATPGAYQTVNGADNVFVGKLNPTGDSLLWATYYGGSVQEECRSIVLDAVKNIYISGGTTSANGIATPCAYQTSLKGHSNAFIAKFNPTGSNLIWGTYYGGNQYDNLPGGTTYLRLGGITLNSSDDIFITGFTTSFNAIASSGAWQPNFSDFGPDAFVAKFSCNSLLPAVAEFSSSNTTICVLSCISFTSLSSNANSWQWTFPGANPSVSTDANPQNICYLDTGSFDVKLLISGCGVTDSLLLPAFINVKQSPPTPVITQVGDTLFSSFDSSYVSYQWFLGDSLISNATNYYYVISQGGNYNLSVKNSIGCVIAVGATIVLGIGNPNIDQFNIYPNPANDQLTVAGLPQSGNNETLEVFNILGEKIYNAEVDQKNITIDVSGFSQGVYYLKFQANGKSAVRKFIKE